MEIDAELHTVPCSCGQARAYTINTTSSQISIKMANGKMRSNWIVQCVHCQGYVQNKQLGMAYRRWNKVQKRNTPVPYIFTTRRIRVRR